MFEKAFVGTPTDYSKREHWLSQPDDPAKLVDLVYLYPSSCRDFRAGVICAVDNRSMVKNARRNLAQQASVFGPQSYHGCDYSFFYQNIRENALDRAAMWFATREHE